MEIVRNAVEIIFYSTMIILGVLSYLQAKKTLFSPIKTEVFKFQLDALKSVLEQFSSRTEICIMDNFDVRNIFTLNYQILLRNYLRTFFPDYQISKQYSEALEFTAAGGYAPIDELPEGAKVGHHGYAITYDSEIIPTEPALKLSKWNSYEYTLVLYTQAFSDKLDSIENLSTNPVIPADLRHMISEYRDLLLENIALMRVVLTKISKQLPEQLPSLETESVDVSWAWNEYRDHWIDMLEHSDAINDWVNRYLRVNLLTDQY